ncbi:hypothetical protein DY000_02038138 [Brassica cretica]|uniref:Kinesin motor domain-containing protein n=1 Tax=Brassica cretica TaxID=69181 RepID=A0ABQ7BQY1_BRACR|nr:hypothetical protein DY000_02038138 [Brassica cretica]
MSAAGGEEKILVSVRVRPLNEKEKTRNDRCDWECINNTTIICNAHNLSDKPSFTFDKVFGFECPTKQVYDDGAREVALCVLSGINSSIFAYGQTSSGKTYTMTGITGFAINDIFLYIDKRMSLLSLFRCAPSLSPGGSIRRNVLNYVSAQRKIGETSLNETSSRSHQILRLTIESSKREVSPESSAILAASVCFVDLAGSERASQTLSAGSRLKEGCHINRSLLTLGTVIRKLSKGKHGHIPYRDSKLTRILQNSLGGNARTAIICTMSPARSHLEQSRNTLLFATCAKEVTTNAQVNMVVSEKALVKQLQRELMRMENELKNLGLGSSSSSSSTSDEFHSLLKQKEEVIEKMEEQIQELKWQRDVAQSRVENLLKSATEYQSSSSSVDYSRRKSYDSTDFDEPRLLNNMVKSNLYSPDEDGFLLDDTTPRIPENGVSNKWEEMGQRTIQEPEDACKEVRCIEENSEKVIIQDTVDNIVEKKVESLSVENEAVESKEEDADSFLEKIDTEKSLYAKDEGQDELTITKLAEEFQETEQSTKKEDIGQNMSKDQPCVNLSKDQSCLEDKQHYESLKADENEAIELEKEDDSSSLSAKLGAKDELTIKKLAAMGQNLWPMANEIEAMESEKEDADSSFKTIDTEMTLSAKHEDEVELTLNKLEEAHETNQYVEKEETNPSLSPKKEDTQQSGQHVQVHGGSDQDETTYEALKNKVKEMQKTIEYFMSMHSAEENQSPSFNTISVNTSPGDSLKMMRRSRSCRENLLFTKAVAAAASGRFTFNTSNNASFDLDNTLSTDAQSTKDSDTETSGGSFHEFMAGLKQMAMQHHSRHESETEAEKTKPERDTKAEFERQQSQIIELWGVCNVPLVHRTYFFLLFKGDPSDFVYMEVELRRLSFLKDSQEIVRKQSAKTLGREREWLAKQIPKKFGRKEREGVYKKWGVELSSKQRSMQVTHKAWTKTKDVDHCKESASLVATLVGFDESNMTPKEMFGLSFSPTTTLDVKSSGWSFSNSFSRISLTGGL